ncbi:inner-membrane translocator [Ketogulonicigenium vulgare Y25]|nr:inner-membrane translocator [Ketogulonicigenium vulgare Y25]
MIRLEKRPTHSHVWTWATPLIAVLATMIAGGLMFMLLGKDPFATLRTIFWDPLFGQHASYYRGQLLIKAGPLILIAVGLSFGFRAGIWNIGAEGQYIVGAICGAAGGLAPFVARRWRWRSIRRRGGIFSR